MIVSPDALNVTFNSLNFACPRTVKSDAFSWVTEKVVSAWFLTAVRSSIPILSLSVTSSDHTLYPNLEKCSLSIFSAMGERSRLT